MPKLAVINTHPIQYYSPLYRQLEERDDLSIHVFYEWRGSLDNAYDPGFEQSLSWDIPLLEGYEYTFVENTASDPGTHHFRGIVTPDLIPTVEEWGPDAVLVFGWNFQAHLRALRHFHGRIPVLFRGDSTLLNEARGPQKWLRRLFLRWVYGSVDRALYVGQNNRAYFEAHGFGKDELTWVPHAIDNNRFTDPDGTNEQKARKWRRELGIPDQAMGILFAGKLASVKGVEVLLEAFTRLEMSDVHLILVGSGPREDQLRERAGSNPQVHFLGFQNQSRMPIAYQLGDVFVLPSRSETWGLAVNEAMACGLPVVVSSHVGCAPDLVDEANGAIVPPDDATALRKALAALLNDWDRLRARGRRSAERISDWSIDVAATRTADVVRDVAS